MFILSQFNIINFKSLTLRSNDVRVEFTFNSSPIEHASESPILFHIKTKLEKSIFGLKTHMLKSNVVKCGNPSNNHDNETGPGYPPILLSKQNNIEFIFFYL